METIRVDELKAENLTFSYDGKNTVVDRACISLSPSRVYVLVGGMASGKTTFLKLLARLLKPTDGCVCIDDTSIWDMKEVELRKRVGISFQYPDKSIFATTVYEEVSFALTMLYPEKKNMYTSLVEKALNIVGLDISFMDRNPHFLSGGEKRRVAIASALVHQPPILILDEPTAGLDGKTKRELLSFLREYASRGRIVLFTTHDLEELSYTDKVFVMHDGKIKEGDTLSMRDWVSLGLLPSEKQLYLWWGHYHGYHE